jgi:hypothetical protein
MWVWIPMENEYIIPIEAKGRDARDMIGCVQISNLVKYARQYFPELPVVQSL